MSCRAPEVRLLVVPGLHDSGPTHWQTWLEAQFRGARRVRQRDWSQPDLHAWSAQIARTVDREPHARWVAVAHSFGCLALAHHMARGGTGIEAALLVAPADPVKFGVEDELPIGRWPVRSVLVASENDPWMRLERARSWAQVWGAHFINLGEAGHINAEAGFGPLPAAKAWTIGLMQHVRRTHRLDFARIEDLSFAI